MDFFEKLKYKAIIQDTADHYHVSPEDVLRDIQAMIDDAWTSSDPSAQKLQTELFPDGKPTPEQFILTLTKYLRKP